MQTEHEIRQSLEKFIIRPKSTLLAQVVEVDETNATCTISDEDVLHYDVRLGPTDEVCSILKVPKKDAFVLVVKIEDSEEWMVVACTEVEKVLINIGGQKLTIDSTGFVFNDGQYGMVKIDQLVSWMGMVYNDILALVPLLNGVGLTFAPTVSEPTIDMFEDALLKH